MSHIASGYVKALVTCPNGECLTPAEKLLLMVLADYHNTETGTSFPSVPTLAAESLVDERKARRLIGSLSGKGVLNVVHPARQGRGAKSEYQFIALEKGGANAPLFEEKEGKKGGQKGGKKGGQIDIANKEEPLAFNLEPKSIAPIIPAWLPKESWDAYLEMRRLKKKNPTEYATKQIIELLDKCRKQGQSVKEILDRSTINCWTGVFPLDNGNGYRNGRRESPERPSGTNAEDYIPTMYNND